MMMGSVATPVKSAENVAHKITSYLLSFPSRRTPLNPEIRATSTKTIRRRAAVIAVEVKKTA
jgi:hypothetical protein